jgi:hypothetical protein
MHWIVIEQAVPSVPLTDELRTHVGSDGLEFAQAVEHEPRPPGLLAVQE